MNSREQKMAKRVLEDALALINKPESWIKGAGARTSRGKRVMATDPRATKFCLVGAYYKVFWDELNRAWLTLDDQLLRLRQKPQ